MGRSEGHRTRVELDPSGNPPESDPLSATRFRHKVLGLILLFGIPALLVLLVESGIAMAALWTLSGARAYVHGESLWAKAQKDAATSLRRYVQTADRQHLEDFRARLGIPLGDRLARNALSRPEPDRTAARVGFLEGGNHPDDVDRMIDFFLVFGGVGPIGQAIEAWTEADRGIEELERLGAEIESAFGESQPGAAQLEEFLREIDRIDRELTVLERAFSDHLSRAARDTERVAAVVVPVSALLVAALMVAWGWWSSRRLRAAVNERQRTEARSVTAQRLEALGGLAAGVAHDFNNLLTAVAGHLDLLRDELPPGASDDSVREIRRAVERGEDLTRRLQAFGRNRPTIRESVDVARALESAVNLARPLLPAEVEVRPVLDGERAYVRGERAQMEQAVVNLILNARDAMPEGGVIDVGCSVESGPAEGDLVIVEVRDPGAGMDPETARRAFEPFFSDRSADRGAGLGLTTVYRVAYEAGGKIELDTDPGEGTTVRLLLPRVAMERFSAAGPATKPADGRLRVLVVEDEAAVRKMVVRLLERQDFEVASADSAESALDLLRDDEAVPDVLVSDVILPGVNGIELARRIRDRWERPGIVLVSGYAPESLPGADRVLEGLRVVFASKPFDAAGLVAAVRSVAPEPAAVAQSLD